MGVGVMVGLGVSVAVGVKVGVRVAVAVGGIVGVSSAVAVAVGVAVGVGKSEGVDVWTTVAEADEVTSPQPARVPIRTMAPARSPKVRIRCIIGRYSVSNIKDRLKVSLAWVSPRA